MERVNPNTCNSFFAKKNSVIKLTKKDKQCLMKMENAYEAGDSTKMKSLLLSDLLNSRCPEAQLLKYLMYISDLHNENPRRTNLLVETYNEILSLKNKSQFSLPNYLICTFEIFARLSSFETLLQIIELFRIDFENENMLYCLNYNIGIVTKIIETFEKNDRHDFLVIVLIKTKFPTSTYRFYIEQLLLPLYEKRKFNEIYQFCEYDVSYAIELVWYLDKHFELANAPLPMKDAVKVMRRLMKIAYAKSVTKIPYDVYQNVQRYSLGATLSYLCKLRFVDRRVHRPQFIGLVKGLIGSHDRHVQLQLLTKLTNFVAFDEVKEWFHYYQLTLSKLPLHLQEIVTRPATVKREPETVVKFRRHYKNLPLDASRVHFVQDHVEFVNAITDLNKSTMIGIDAEWKSFCPTFGKESDLALLQLATETDVYLIDMLKLKRETVCWNQLMKTFNSDQILKIGFGFADDFQRLYQTVPEIEQAHLSPGSFIDLSLLFQELRSNETIEKIITEHDPKHASLREGDNIEWLSLYSTLLQRQPEPLLQLVPSTETKIMAHVHISETFSTGENSLSRLIRILFGNDLNKTWQISNWEQRPLHPEQITYAALDAYCLIEAFKCLRMLCEQNDVDFDTAIFNSNQKKSRKLTSDQ